MAQGQISFISEFLWMLFDGFAPEKYGGRLSWLRRNQVMILLAFRAGRGYQYSADYQK